MKSRGRKNPQVPIPTPQFDEIHLGLREAFGPDRPALADLLARTARAARAGRPHERNLQRLTQQLAQSRQRVVKRRQHLPSPDFTAPSIASLPIVEHRPDIAAAIGRHQVVVICGDTGSGKSTQLPKICLELGRGVHGLIGHTQPRRIAARSLAARLSDELHTPPSEVVGFKIRFTDTTQPGSYVKLMTDGILLAETQGDRDLWQYDTLIIDEAHERSLNIDFLLGYLRRLLPRRPDLKAIVTSATIDPHRFAEHFAGADGSPAPIIQISGRTYPVEVRYRPPGVECTAAGDSSDHPRSSDECDDRDVTRAILDAVDELTREDRTTTPGDILIFLPTQRDILETARVLRGHRLAGDGPGRDTEILPLYARLSVAEQNRIFKPHGRRRIVLATNVAETSLTVPGIRYVIDTGTARISRYSPRAKVQRLPIEAISQASAEQRKGRCGRTEAGVCIRLYDEADLARREPFTPPEIVRCNLASVILQMKALRLGELADFPFIDPPKRAAIRDGYQTLHEIEAVDERDRLTDVGRQLARLPLDPRLGRMLLAARQQNVLAEVLVIVAALSVMDPRLRPTEAQQAADEAHKQFTHERSDFLTLLNIWRFYHDLMHKLSRGKLQRACQQNFLSYVRMREWLDVYRQLRTLLEEADLKIGLDKPDENAIHRCLLVGLLSNIAQRTDAVTYTGPGGKKLYLWPGSVLFDARPAWIVAAEQVETSRLYARTVCPINPAWLEHLAPHLIKRSYSEPHWQADGARVAAYEKVSLFGLTIVPRRLVHYGPINPRKSREMFIHHGLVEGDCDLDAPCLRHNREQIERLSRLEAKLRQRDVLAGVETRFAFYDKRLPADVYNGPLFQKWRKNAERDDPRLLYMTEDDLLTRKSQDVEPDDFPDALTGEGLNLPLDYALKPGEVDDGVTVTLPAAAMAQIDPQRLDWMVPGLLKEKVTAMIRGLPKDLRRALVPVPDTAERVVAKLHFGRGALTQQVAAQLHAISGQDIPPHLLAQTPVPPHLQMNIRVVDCDGRVLAQSRDLGELRKTLPADTYKPRLAHDDFNRDAITAWDFGDLPGDVEIADGNFAMRGFPRLEEAGGSVALRVFENAVIASRRHRGGLRRLIVRQLETAIRGAVAYLPQFDRMATIFAILDQSTSLREQLELRVADHAFLDPRQIGPAAPPILKAAEFEACLDAGWSVLSTAAGEVGDVTHRLLSACQRLRVTLDQAADKPKWRHAVEDVREQLGELLAADFLVQTPWPWLWQYPRYLEAAARRLAKLAEGRLERDRELTAHLRPVWTACLRKQAAKISQGTCDEALDSYRWMLEEYRVSLFAQELGTAVPVSEKRLAQQWACVGA